MRFPDLPQLQYFYYAVLIVIAITGALVTFVGRSWVKRKTLSLLKSPWTGAQLLSQIAHFPADFAAYREENKNQFKVIEAQLTRNGGSSMRDTIDRIEQNQVFLGNKLRFVDDRSPQALFEMQVREFRGERFFDCIYVNPAMCRMLGYPANHLLGMNLLEKIEEQEREAFLGLWNIALKTGSPFSSRHHIQHGESNHLLHVKFIAQPQRDAAGRLCHYYGHLEHASRSNA